MTKQRQDKYAHEIKAYLKFVKTHPVGKIPYQVAREGAGENRIPLTHLVASVPVYVMFLAKLSQDKSKTVAVLDIGCGTGRNISFVKQALNKNWSFYGVDYSKACIEFARKQYAKVGVQFVQYEGATLPFPDDSFDYVVSSHVMEHIAKSNQTKFAKEIRRVLKSGGLALVGEPNRKYCQDLLAINPRDDRRLRLVLPHEHEHYLDELRPLYQKAGFKNIEIWQTHNPQGRKMFETSTKYLRPGKSVWSRTKYSIYNSLRQNHFLQDIMARVGTELLMHKQKLSYLQILESTEIWQKRGDFEGDNFVARLIK